MNAPISAAERPRSKISTAMAVGGSLLITLIASALANAEAASSLILYSAITAAYAGLGVGLGLARGRMGLALAALVVGTAAAAAFGFQGVLVAIAVSRNPYSHNLWPIELVSMTAQFTFFSLASFIGVLVGNLFRRTQTR